MSALTPTKMKTGKAGQMFRLAKQTHRPANP
jgi:hypothetical protein